MRTKELFSWIKERHSINQKKLAGKPKPWTKDPILQSYRFCNVHREDDKVTQWIRINWREPHDADQNLWFAMYAARIFNNPVTLANVGYPVPWIARRHATIKRYAEVRGGAVFNGAYRVVSAARKGPTASVYCDILNDVWAVRSKCPKPGASLHDLHRWLVQREGLGSFLAAQVVADVKYQTAWRTAPDWETFAAPGPGSLRGLNRVFGFHTSAPWDGGALGWHTNLLLLKKEIDPLAIKAGIPPIHAQDLQNCLCEFDKYERTRLGEGKPRSKYSGGTDDFSSAR
jgi:hypothetical protein